MDTRYEHVPKLIETRREGKVTVLWNQRVQADRTGPNNKSFLIIPGNVNEHVC